MFFRSLFKKDYIYKNDDTSIIKTVKFFKIFFKNKNFIKDKKDRVEIVLVESNIIKYIETCNDILMGDLNRVNILLNSDIFMNSNVKSFITIDGYIYLEHEKYIEELFFLLERLIELDNNINPKIVHRYIIHMLDIFRCIYKSY